MTELNELYHFGIKGQRWGVRRFQNADGTLTSDGRKRYQAYKKDWKSYNKLNRHVAASQKHLKEEGIMVDRVRDKYLAENKKLEKVMRKSTGLFGLKGAEKAEAVAKAQLSMDRIGKDYTQAAGTYGVAKKILDQDTKALKRHVDGMIKAYGKGSINELQTETVKMGQNKLQKILQGAPKSIIFEKGRETEEFVKTGKTLADMPVIGNLYVSKYIAGRELDLMRSKVESAVSAAKRGGKDGKEPAFLSDRDYFKGVSSEPNSAAEGRYTDARNKLDSAKDKRDEVQAALSDLEARKSTMNANDYRNKESNLKSQLDAAEKRVDEANREYKKVKKEDRAAASRVENSLFNQRYEAQRKEERQQAAKRRKEAAKQFADDAKKISKLASAAAKAKAKAELAEAKVKAEALGTKARKKAEEAAAKARIKADAAAEKVREAKQWAPVFVNAAETRLKENARDVANYWGLPPRTKKSPFQKIKTNAKDAKEYWDYNREMDRKTKEKRKSNPLKYYGTKAVVNTIGAGTAAAAAAVAGPLAGYAVKTAIKKHKKKKQQEAWNNFWGIKHSAAYRVVRSDELYHHGIKGQRWGVRRYQNSDGTLTAKGRARYGKRLEKEGGVYLKKGSMVQRVSDVDETPGGNPNGTKHMYVAFTDEDKFRYKMASRNLGGTKFTLETPLGYQIDLKVKDDILAPGLKTQVDTAIDHVKNMSMDEVKSKFIDKKGYMKSTLYDDPEDFVSDLMKNNGSDKISDFQKRAYLHYSRNLMKDKDLRDQFFKSLSDKGYNAVIDYNDVAKWGISGDGKPTVVKGFSDKPLIVFDSSKSLEKVGSHAITYDEMANDAKNLKKMYSNRSALKKFGGAAAATAAAVPTAFVSPMAATVIAMYGGMFGITIPGMKDSIKSSNYSYYEKAYRKYANMQKNDPVAYKKSVKNIIDAVNKSKEAEKEAEKKDKAEG